DFSPLVVLIRLKKVDWIVFASASAVINLCSIIPKEWGKTWSSNLKVACLGEITKNAAMGQGLNVEVLPEVQNFEHLAKAISDYVSKQGQRI
ncbi:MAG: uroporphyrinogen-III synthase, partial [SAR324 cluster bacterium]|nr:uroporphyrinogen-III synthase [SAR324 cluster bacterium]